MIEKIWIKFAPSEAARDELFAKLWQRQFQLLKYVDVAHPKLMLCFGGVPASGKTTLAEAIELKFQGIRLSNHELRLLLGELLPGSQTSEHNQIIGAYEPFMLEQVSALPNGFLIIDSGIERKYRQFFAWAKAHHYELLTVDFAISKEEATDRISRTKPNPELFLTEMDRWWAEHEAFRKEFKADIVLGPADDNQAVFKRITQLLDK